MPEASGLAAAAGRTFTKDLVWLKARAPLPIMADESYLSAKDLDRCAECYHAVNVKLVKAGGISAAFEALRAARKAGLKTMIGCRKFHRSAEPHFFARGGGRVNRIEHLLHLE